MTSEEDKSKKQFKFRDQLNLHDYSVSVLLTLTSRVRQKSSKASRKGANNGFR